MVMAAGAAGLVGVAKWSPDAPTPRSALDDPRFVDIFGRVNFDRLGHAIPVNRYSGLAELHDLSDPGALMACWSSDSPPTPEEAAWFMARMPRDYSGRYFIGARWAGNQGDPITITWSLAPDGIAWDGGANNLFADLDAKFGGNRALWISLIEASFARWSDLTGITYQRVSVAGQDWDDGAAFGAAGSASRGTVRIGSRSLGGANGTLAYNYFPSNGDMVLDSSESWGASANQYRFFRNVVMHEHGHGMGLEHSCPFNGIKLMEPGLVTTFDGPQQDDIRGMQRNYGDPFEPNNTIATSTPLDGIAGGSIDPINPGSVITLGTLPPNQLGQPNPGNSSILSLDANGEVDFFRFDLAAARLVTVTVTPIGTTYTDLPQNANGSCPNSPTNNVNALAIADIAVDLLNPSGQVLATANATAAGASEVLTGVLAPAGTSHIRVQEANAPTESQLYRVQVQPATTTFSLTASDGTFPSFVRLTWTTVPNAVNYRILRNTTDTRTGATTVYTGTATTFDDATPNTSTFFYWVDVQQNFAPTIWKQVAADQGNRTNNFPPVADAGPDILAIDADRSGAEIVQLNASASTDPENAIVEYEWFRTGQGVIATGVTPSVSFPVGTASLILTVRDAAGLTDNDFVNITVNQPPLANAGVDQTLVDTDDNGTEQVSLNGSASTDLLGTISSYSWRVAGSQVATGATPTITLPVGVTTVELIVTDNLGWTNADTVLITIEEAPVGPTCPECPADFDGDGGVTGADVESFFAAFEIGDPCADTDADGGVTGADVEAFFLAFEAGGC
jgi:hypothetical protein